jgi:hypothetical protein
MAAASMKRAGNVVFEVFGAHQPGKLFRNHAMDIRAFDETQKLLHLRRAKHRSAADVRHLNRPDDL